MDPLYSTIMGKTRTMVCEYKSKDGEVQSLEFESSPCGGGPTFSMEIGVKGADGKAQSASATTLYVEHRSVMLGSAIGGSGESSLAFAVMSATQYADILRYETGESPLPKMDDVPSVTRNDKLYREGLAKGAMNCRLEHREPFCIDPR
jgi:hypothetical protein